MPFPVSIYTFLYISAQLFIKTKYTLLIVYQNVPNCLKLKNKNRKCFIVMLFNYSICVCVVSLNKLG